MAVEWTRIAVALHNEARDLLDGGRAEEAVVRFTEALRALPSTRPTLDALIRYGLAEALATAGDVAGAKRSATRALRGNRRLRNGEGEDACRRLLARLSLRRGRLSAVEAFVVFELGVRPAQRRLREGGRRPRVRIGLWERLPLARLRRGEEPVPPRRFLFTGDELVSVTASRWDLTSSAPVVHLALGRSSPSTVSMDLLEDFGAGDVLARRFRIRRDRQGRFTIAGERLLSA